MDNAQYANKINIYLMVNVDVKLDMHIINKKYVLFAVIWKMASCLMESVLFAQEIKFMMDIQAVFVHQVFQVKIIILFA